MSENYIKCAVRQPTESGEYNIINNSSCNGGRGVVSFIAGKGWQVPDMIKSFYKILAWQEK